MKKLLLTLGSMASVATPVVAVVACGSKDYGVALKDTASTKTAIVAAANGKFVEADVTDVSVHVTGYVKTKGVGYVAIVVSIKGVKYEIIGHVSDNVTPAAVDINSVGVHGPHSEILDELLKPINTTSIVDAAFTKFKSEN